MRRVGETDLHVQVCAQPRLHRHLGPAVLDDDRVDQNLVAHGRIVADPLLDHEVRGRGVEVERGAHVDRAERIVRGEAGVVDLGHRRDLAPLEDAAAVGQVRLEDDGRLLLQDVAEPPLREEALAGRDRDAALPRDGRHRRRVLRQAGLLEEEDAVLLDRLADLDRHRRAEPTMGIDREVDVRPDRIADRLHDLRRLPDRSAARRAAWSAPNGTSFIAVKPRSFIRSALSAISSGVSPRGPLA